MAPDALEFKKKGNDCFRLKDFEGAIAQYSAAIAHSLDPTDPNLFSNRAQAHLQLEQWEAAELDCTAAMALDDTITKLYYRRATARKALKGKAMLQGAISDYEKWLKLAKRDGTADPATIQLMQDAITTIELELAKKPEKEAKAPKETKSRSSNSKATETTTPVPTKPEPKAEVIQLPDSSAASNVETADSLYGELKDFWKEKGDVIITRWGDTFDPSARAAMLKTGFSTFESPKHLRSYPEFQMSRISENNNVVDFVSSRANRSPSSSAFHLDLVRTQIILAQAEAPATASSIQNTAYMMLTDAAYGRIVQCDPKKPAEVEKKKKAIELGEACGKFEGLYMLERQVECYKAALRAAHSIGDNEFYVADELITEFKEKLGNKTYTGRETYCIARVEEIVLASRAYAEDHMDFLRNDVDYVSDRLLDRLPTVTIDTKMTEVIAITEGKELILNAFARQTLWKEALNVIANLKDLNYELGNGIPLSQAYQQKIGLLSKLVESYATLTLKELSAAITKCFEKEFAAERVLEQNEDKLLAFFDMMAEIQGFPYPDPRAKSRNPRKDPLAALFKLLIEPKDQQNTRSWETVACLKELTELFDRLPDQKTRLSRRAVEALGEYTEAVELREIVIESHRPRFNRELADRSNYLTGVTTLWQQLERCWTKVVSCNMIGLVMRTKSADTLDDIWSRFEKEVVKQHKKLPQVLFDELLSNKIGHHDRKFVLTPFGDKATIFATPTTSTGPKARITYTPYVDSDDSDAESVAAEEEEEEEDEVPEAHYPDSDPSSDEPAVDSDDSDYQMSLQRIAKKKAARASRAAVRPPVANARPGPSTGKNVGINSSGGRNFVDDSSDGVKKTKVKTRNEKDGRGATEDDSDIETGEESSPLDGLTFKVTKRVYDTFQQYLGSGSIQRTDVAWADFLHAMNFIGWTPDRGSGSSWKFRPRGQFKLNESITIHEPHPDATQRVDQVRWTGSRLKRMYGMTMSMFVMV